MQKTNRKARNHKPVSWNVYRSETVATNNNSDNNALASKLKKHPNFYTLCGELKKELDTSQIDALAAKTGNNNSKQNTRKKEKDLEKSRQ